jgi:hypothetical protein
MASSPISRKSTRYEHVKAFGQDGQTFTVSSVPCESCKAQFSHSSNAVCTRECFFIEAQDPALVVSSLVDWLNAEELLGSWRGSCKYKMAVVVKWGFRYKATDRRHTQTQGQCVNDISRSEHRNVSNYLPVDTVLTTQQTGFFNFAFAFVEEAKCLLLKW